MSRDLATLLAASFKAASEEQGEWSPEFVRNFLTTLVLDAPPEALRAATLAAQEARMPGDIWWRWPRGSTGLRTWAS